jgi:flavorubredoxin
MATHKNGRNHSPQAGRTGYQKHKGLRCIKNPLIVYHQRYFQIQRVYCGSCAYNNALFPAVETLISTIAHMGIKNHYLGIFGNYSWNGGGVKNLMAFADSIKWEMVYEPIEEKGALKISTREQLIALADAMADKLE